MSRRCTPFFFSYQVLKCVRSMIVEDQVIAHDTLRTMLANGTPGHFDCRFTSGKCAYTDVLPLSSGALRENPRFHPNPSRAHMHTLSICCAAVGSLTDQTEQRLFVQQQLDAERLRAETAEKQRYLQESFVDIGQHRHSASHHTVFNILMVFACFLQFCMSFGILSARSSRAPTC